MFSAFSEVFLILLSFRGAFNYLALYFVETRFTVSCNDKNGCFAPAQFIIIYFSINNLLSFARLLSQYETFYLRVLP